jgi:long-chain fatty acid transport protein
VHNLQAQKPQNKQKLPFMKRSLKVLVFLLAGMPFMLQAGGLMTNTNQSASYIRMPVLDAIIGPEGGYYNPAGLSFLRDGFYISVSNQTIAQKRTIQSTFPNMNRNEFEGTVSAPIFPSAYLTYKQGPLAFSIGVNPIGGGGSALFEEGLPSFEQQVAVLPGMLTTGGIPTTQYSFSTNFDAQSIFWGIQGTASYAINDMISVAAGLRYVTATNTYKGYLQEIQINPALPILGLNGSAMISAPGFFGQMAGIFGQLSGVASSLQPIVAGGGGGLTLNQAVSMGFITAEQALSVSGGFALIDPNINPATLSIAQIQGAYSQATPQFQAMQAQMQASQAMTADKKVDVTQKGSSIAPIFGVHFRFSDRLNLALKYEHKTNLNVENQTDIDDLGVYPNGMEVANNLPSMLSAGVSFGATDRLTLHSGLHYYFDKSADYGKVKSWSAGTPTYYSNEEIIDSNFWEAGLGAEFRISRMFLVSAGYLRTQTGVNELYHSDQSHSLSTNTFGAGFRVQLNDMLAVNLGGLYSQYITHEKDFMGAGFSYRETYDRSNMVFAVGVDLKF